MRRSLRGALRAGSVAAPALSVPPEPSNGLGMLGYMPKVATARQVPQQTSYGSFASPPPVFEVRSSEDRRAGVLAQVVRALPAVVCAGAIALGLLASPVLGATLAFVAAFVFAANLWLGSSRRLISAFGARPIRAIEDARLVNVVDGLCVANGLRRPVISVLEDDAPNVLVIGRSEQAAVLVCTSGLLAMLDRIELEGAIAHALAQVKRGDILRARTATTALGTYVALVPRSGRLLARVAGLSNVPYEDLAAVSMTRYPPGLISAMEKLNTAPSTRPRGMSPLTARLTAAMWLVPLEEAMPARPAAGILDIELRTAALREL